MEGVTPQCRVRAGPVPGVLTEPTGSYAPSQGPAFTGMLRSEAWGEVGSAGENHASSSLLSVALPLMAQGALDFLFLPSLFPVTSFTVPAYPRVSAVGRSQRGKWQTLFLRVFGFFKFLPHVTVLILGVLLKLSAASPPPNSSRCPSKLTKVALWLLKGPEHRERFAWTMRAPQVLPLALPVQIPDRP